MIFLLSYLYILCRTATSLLCGNSTSTIDRMGAVMNDVTDLWRKYEASRNKNFLLAREINSHVMAPPGGKINRPKTVRKVYYDE